MGSFTSPLFCFRVVRSTVWKWGGRRSDEQSERPRYREMDLVVDVDGCVVAMKLGEN